VLTTAAASSTANGSAYLMLFDLSTAGLALCDGCLLVSVLGTGAEGWKKKRWRL